MRTSGIWPLVAVCLLAVTVFLPLAGYYFSQDDFVLIQRAMGDLGGELGRQFGQHPHYFRPLTKVLYFASAFPLFGANAAAYHVVSLILHLANVVLVYLLLRRLRLVQEAAFIAAGVFGLSASFTHAVGWISSVQQLAATLFMYGSILLSTRGHRGSGTVAYVLALLSLEQTFLTPVFGIMIARLGLTAAGRWPVRRIASTFGPQVALMTVYGVFRLWKGTPTEGILKFGYGTNILDNLAAYGSALYDFWPDRLGIIMGAQIHLNASHIVLIGLVAYHLIRRRFAMVTFALVFLLGTLFAGLFAVRHYTYYQTYVPALGSLILLAGPLGDVLSLVRRAQVRRAVTAVVVLLFTVASFTTVRGYTRRVANNEQALQVSFVLHRAVVAARARDDLTRIAGHLVGIRSVYLMAGTPERGYFGRTDSEIEWAFGRGALVNVVSGNFNVDVRMDHVGIPPREAPDTRVIFYDKTGRCYAYDEVMEGREPPDVFR